MKLNLTAPLNQLSLGLWGTNLLSALHRQGHEPALWPIGPVEVAPEHQGDVQKAYERSKFFEPNAPSVRLWHPFDLSVHVGKGPRVGLTIFELDRFTAQERHHLLAQDLVVTCSGWGRRVLVDNGVPEERVRVSPLGVDPNLFSPQVGSGGNDTSGSRPTIFINVGKWEYRKGHDVLAEAFNRAFTPEDNVRLVLLAANPFLSPQEHAEWVRLYRGSWLGGKVVVCEQRYAHQRDVAAVMQGADCGVFPSRAEGFNLPLLELMAMGKHCVATACSAHLEFANPDNCRLIEVDEGEVAFDGRWFFGQGAWARFGERQMDQLVHHMREVHRLKQDHSLGVNTAGIATARQFTWENTARTLIEAIA